MKIQKKKFLSNINYIYLTTWHYIPEDKILYSELIWIDYSQLTGAKITKNLKNAYIIAFGKTEPESELLYDLRFTTNRFVLAPSPLRLTTEIFYLTGNTLHLRYKDQPVNTVYYENHTENTNTLCGQTAEFLCVKADGIYSNRWV
jgi:hypothetical protein